MVCWEMCHRPPLVFLIRVQICEHAVLLWTSFECLLLLQECRRAAFQTHIKLQNKQMEILKELTGRKKKTLRAKPYQCTERAVLKLTKNTREKNLLCTLHQLYLIIRAIWKTKKCKEKMKNI